MYDDQIHSLAAGFNHVRKQQTSTELPPTAELYQLKVSLS